MLDLFQLKDKLPLAREVLQEVALVPIENERLKALSRWRKQLVFERMRASQRTQANLQAVCPGLLDITGQADNLWFLNLITCRADLRKCYLKSGDSMPWYSSLRLFRQRQANQWQRR
jgi:hypothetical protein